MPAETQLNILLKNMQSQLHIGDFVFCTLQNISAIDINEVLLLFKEEEGVTLIVKKETADKLQLSYSFIAAWITLKVNSSLEAVGFTAAFSTALSNNQISCNVVAAYHHDHIFVNKKDAEKAMDVLRFLAR
jgi:uncharacterized protein